MATLELKFLGDLEVRRDGDRLELPPSRKTRALLAYLALNGRPFRREHLCELLWEIPDDPRGSLRWSLSKLRRLVDDEGCRRIVADRVNVRFAAADVAIDAAMLEAIAADGSERPIDELERAAARYGGTPLEGIDFPTFHDFAAWCIGERERMTGAQVRLLKTLIRRLDGDPERALPQARALVRIAPYDEAARAALIRLLVALGRGDQAEQQYELGARLLEEAGAAPTGALHQALRGTPGQTRGSSTHAARHEDAPRSDATPSGAAGNKPAVGPHIPPLIGRDKEIEQIEAALARVMSAGHCAAVLVRGEPGIGKSRLLEATAALARAAGALVLEAAAFESESVRPFALFIDALRKLEPNAVAAVFERADSSNRDRLLDALAARLTERARQQPVVLVFDDLQWSDESSAAALHYVVRTSADLPLLVLLAARTDEVRDNTPVVRALRGLRQAELLEEIELAALGEDAVRAIIATRAPQADGARLSRECGGNPLLAIELARAEVAGDSGQSLSEVVQERLARFDADGGELLRWAAVLAPRIDAATLARLTGLDWNQIGEALEAAARQSMLLPTDRGFRFSHDLIARSIYSGISPARRRTMHRRVAELLEQDTMLDPERAADLAHHAAQSGDAGLAARAMVSAGRLCLRFFANDEALGLARKGLQWLEQLPDAAERVCLTLDLKELMLAAAPVEDWEAAAREYAALAERALDHGALDHARRGYYMASYVHWMHGQWTGAREEILQSSRVARGGGDEAHIIGMAEAARCLAMIERDLTQADAMVMEAQALAARKGVSHHSLSAALGMLRLHENKLDEAAEHFEEARTLARTSGDRLSEYQSNEYLAMLDYERDRLESARQYGARLIELGEKLREGSELPFAHAFDALCHYALTGDSTPLEPALEELRAADAKHRLAYTLTRAALLDIERRRPDDAIVRASEALAYAEALDRTTEIMLAHAALARARKAANDSAGHARHVAALESLEQAPVAHWARARALEIAGG